MPTVEKFIDNILSDHIMGGIVERRNTLQGSLSTSDETITLAREIQTLTEGARVTIGLEEMYVYEVNPTARTAIVERGQFGSDALAHADEATVHVDPNFSHRSVFDIINDEIQALSGPGKLYQPKSGSFTFSPTVFSYDLTGYDDIMDLVAVYAELQGPTQEWPQIRAEVLNDAPTSDFTSGKALRLWEPGTSGRKIHFIYKAAFTQLTADDYSSDIATATLIPASALDVLKLSVAIRLIASREVPRNHPRGQGSTRRAEEIPPGAILQSVNGLVKVRDARLAEERSKLERQHKVRDLPRL